MCVHVLYARNVISHRDRMRRGWMKFLEARLRLVVSKRFLQAGDDVVSQCDRLYDGDGRTLRAYPKMELPGVGNVGGE